MEYLVALDVNSVAGQFVLSMHGKIGGSTATLVCNAITHPVIVATDLEWFHPNFVRMKHHRNPGAEDPIARELVLPCSAILFATPKEKPAEQARGQQENPTSLH